MQKLAEICVRRPVFATMLILSITVVGLFSFRSLGVDSGFEIICRRSRLRCRQAGRVAAGDRNRNPDKVEGAVNTISGIDELRLNFGRRRSQVFVSFVLEKNADVAASEVRNKVD